MTQNFNINQQRDVQYLHFTFTNLIVSFTALLIVNMSESVVSSCNTLWPIYSQFLLCHSQVKLIILPSPTPELVPHSTTGFEIGMGEKENTTDILFIMVKRVKLGTFWGQI